MAGSFTTRFNTAPEESAKAPCVVATTANISLSGEQTIGSVSVVAGDRVLVMAQTDATENGIYDASTISWSRSTDFNNSDDVLNGIIVVVSDPSNKAIYQAAFTGDYTPDTTEVTFSEILFNTLTSKTGSAGIQSEYNAQGQYLINYMDDLIGVDLTSFPVGETVICNDLNVGSPGTHSIWEKVADGQTPPDPATGLNTADGRWYSALTNATEFKQVAPLSCLTIADLKLIEGTPDQLIDVISYDTPNYSNPNPYSETGKFAWDSTSTETDNSATLKTVIQATGVTTGRWIRVYDAIVDAGSYYTGEDTETVLQEVGSTLASHTTTLASHTESIGKQISGQFAPHEAATPDMTIVVDAGKIYDGLTFSDVAQQTTTTITPPVTNPRIDRVVINGVTGVYSIIAGSEAASPVAPTITSGSLPCCQVYLTVGMTEITDSDITDERAIYVSKSFRGARAYRATNFNILHDTSTFLLFDAESYDTDSVHDLVSNTDRLTVPTGVTKVRLEYFTMLEAGNDYTKFGVSVYKNGSAFAAPDNANSNFYNYGITTQNPEHGKSTGVISVTGGDYFQLSLIHSNTAVATRYAFGSTNNACWFAMEIIE